MPISKPFQDRLTMLVDDYSYGHTRSEVRALIGISSGSFTNALLYGIIPTPKTLVKIADFFETSLNYLLGKSAANDFSPTIEKRSFAQRFAQLCQERSITYYKVSSDCGFDNSLIVRWFSKGYLPSLQILEWLCAYFQVSPDYLLGRTDFRD